MTGEKLEDRSAQSQIVGRALISDMAEEFRYCIPHLSDALQSGSSDPWNCGGRAALQVKCDTDWICAFVLLLRTKFGVAVECSLLHSPEVAPAKAAAWCLKLLSLVHTFWLEVFIDFVYCGLFPTMNKLADSLHLQIKLTVLGQTAKFVVGDPP